MALDPQGPRSDHDAAPARILGTVACVRAVCTAANPTVGTVRTLAWTAAGAVPGIIARSVVAIVRQAPILEIWPEAIRTLPP